MNESVFCVHLLVRQKTQMHTSLRYQPEPNYPYIHVRATGIMKANKRT